MPDFQNNRQLCLGFSKGFVRAAYTFFRWYDRETEDKPEIEKHLREEDKIPLPPVDGLADLQNGTELGQDRISKQFP